MYNIKAYSEDNAVKVIAFAVYFNQRLLNEDIDKLINASSENEFFKKEFSQQELQNELALTFNPSGIQNQTQDVSGIVCQSLDDNGKESWMLNINRESIVVTCKNYTRWNNISNKAYEYISESFNLLKNKNISQVTLEYLDEFEILSTSKEWKKLLFKDENKYLAPNIYKIDDFWHVNHGYFVNLENLENKLLNTININYFADGLDSLKPKVNIRAQHHLRYERGEDYKNKDLKNIFDSIHLHSKNIFEEIVHDDILKNFKRGDL